MEVKKQYILDSIPEDWTEVFKFIKGCNKQCYYGKIENSETLIIDEVQVGSKQFLINIDMMKKKISFTDDLVVLEQVVKFVDGIDHLEWKEAFNQLKDAIEKYGFKLLYTGNRGNDDYLWYMVEIDVHNFTEKNLKEVSKLWNAYNEKRRNIYEKLRKNK